MYKISIILPVYNVDNYLERCLSSLLNQTIGFENLEIIFIDDFSDDESFNIISKFTKEYENIKLFQTESNSGSAGFPRNIGLNNASADYIMFLDPDDVYFVDACEKLYLNAINTNADIVSGNYISYSDGKKVKPINFYNYFGNKSDYYEITNIKDCPELLTMIPALWTKIYKKSFLKNNNLIFLENVVSQDLYFVNQCLIRAKKIVYIDTPIVKYEIREEGSSKSVTATINRKHLLDYIFVYNSLYNLFENYDKDFAWMASVHLFFCTIQFVKNQNKVDKYDYLHNSEKLYSEFKNHYTPKIEYKYLFDLINSHNYVDAIKLSELMYNRIYNPTNILNIKEKEVLFLFNNEREINEFLIDNIGELNELSSKFNFSFINFNINPESESFKLNKNEYNKLLNNINLINLVEYFNNQVSIGQSGEEKENNSEVLNLSYENDSHKIILFKKGYELFFKSLDELKCYFITNYCLNFKSKVFIIQADDNFNLNQFKNSSFIHVINNEKSIIDILNNAYFNYNVNQIREKISAKHSRDLIISHKKTIEFNKETIENADECLCNDKKEITNLENDILNYQKFVKQLNKIIHEKDQILENQEEEISSYYNLIKLQDKLLNNTDKIFEDID